MEIHPGTLSNDFVSTAPTTPMTNVEIAPITRLSILVSPGMAFWGCPTPPCYPNCDASTGSPILNVNDFVCFSQRFAARDPYANCDHSTEPQPLNVADFVCFTQQFAAGCR